MFKPKPGDLVYLQGLSCGADEVYVYVGSIGATWTVCNFFNPTITRTFNEKDRYQPRKSGLNRFDIRRLSKHFRCKYKIGDKVEISYSISTALVFKTICEIVQTRLLYDSKRKRCQPGYHLRIVNTEIFPKFFSAQTARICLEGYPESAMKPCVNYNKLWNMLIY